MQISEFPVSWHYCASHIILSPARITWDNMDVLAATLPLWSPPAYAKARSAALATRIMGLGRRSSAVRRLK